MRIMRLLIPLSAKPVANLIKHEKLFFSSSAIKMAKETYSLKYFNFKVLGEPIRWQFALAGVPFNDIRIARDATWDSENKHKLGFGRLPILVINDETEITQSTAISRFLAKKFGLLPKSELLQARCDELVDNLQDLRLLWRPWIRESDPAKKAVIEKELKEAHFPFYLPKVEEFIKKFGTPEKGFAVGKELTWADLYVANFMQIWTENHGSEILDQCPLLRKHMNAVLDIPKIKEWNAKRPATKH